MNGWLAGAAQGGGAAGGGGGGVTIEVNTSTEVNGACQKELTAVSLGLESADWSELVFNDNYLNVAVNTNEQKITVYFDDLNHSEDTITVSSNTEDVTGSITVTNSSYVPNAHYILVDTTDDLNINNQSASSCSLRNAIDHWAGNIADSREYSDTKMNSCEQIDTGDATLQNIVIHFSQEASGLYSYGINEGNEDDDNMTGDFDLSCNTCMPLYIYGCGFNSTHIDADSRDRVFDIDHSANVTFKNITLKHGLAADGFGGAISCKNTNLTFSDLVIRESVAQGPLMERTQVMPVEVEEAPD